MRKMYVSLVFLFLLFSVFAQEKFSIAQMPDSHNRATYKFQPQQSPVIPENGDSVKSAAKLEKNRTVYFFVQKKYR